MFALRKFLSSPILPHPLFLPLPDPSPYLNPYQDNIPFLRSLGILTYSLSFNLSFWNTYLLLVFLLILLNYLFRIFQLSFLDTYLILILPIILLKYLLLIIPIILHTYSLHSFYQSYNAYFFPTSLILSQSFLSPCYIPITPKPSTPSPTTIQSLHTSPPTYPLSPAGYC